MQIPGGLRKSQVWFQIPEEELIKVLGKGGLKGRRCFRMDSRIDPREFQKREDYEVGG